MEKDTGWMEAKRVKSASCRRFLSHSLSLSQTPTQPIVMQAEMPGGQAPFDPAAHGLDAAFRLTDFAKLKG